MPVRSELKLGTAAVFSIRFWSLIQETPALLTGQINSVGENLENGAAWTEVAGLLAALTSVTRITIKAFRDLLSSDEADSEESEANQEKCLSHLQMLWRCWYADLSQTAESGESEQLIYGSSRSVPSVLWFSKVTSPRIWIGRQWRFYLVEVTFI